MNGGGIGWWVATADKITRVAFGNKMARGARNLTYLAGD